MRRLLRSLASANVTAPETSQMQKRLFVAWETPSLVPVCIRRGLGPSLWLNRGGIFLAWAGDLSEDATWKAPDWIFCLAHSVVGVQEYKPGPIWKCVLSWFTWTGKAPILFTFSYPTHHRNDSLSTTSKNLCKYYSSIVWLRSSKVFPSTAKKFRAFRCSRWLSEDTCRNFLLYDIILRFSILRTLCITLF